ncbi:MAG: internal scaffolding protein [Microvirus sp.]|nr:MAG: internal scaffolding protein [Microvirus sp.]
MFLRSIYNYDTDNVSEETGLECKDISMAQQHQKDEADINIMLRKFGITGEMPTSVRMPQYGDFLGISDYQGAMNAVRAADEAFAELPAHIRSRFANDPEQFVEFCLDEANKAEAIRLGLVTQEELAAAAAGNPAAAVVSNEPVAGEGKAL